MKISIPSMGQGGTDDVVGQHFGKVPAYTVYDTETGEFSVIPNTSEHNGGTGLPPELMAESGVELMLCGGLGKKAVVMFEQFGIDVFVGASGKVADAIDAWKAGKLSKATHDNACGGHDHDHSHDHAHCH
ncbi:NifB/NifX family molybdenum-iron cluster-binding protein [Methanolobus halotolerans]|uniref:Dinitrogenase iron-molybdenum cofactor biosynthesis protein n=1 Tax=Methanolobus halotolerans TaxID=2052935 RepID=A0A4E0PXI3_9EURY|nr:NifB/NifX family molybdenum-iron cluster-binding protein [Methanolobus halotolerans]TGC10928.1 dinitrogenase iron-molybdenum cofactor biosynthesis protein [Methanolobus halotolerans]